VIAFREKKDLILRWEEEGVGGPTPTRVRRGKKGEKTCLRGPKKLRRKDRRTLNLVGKKRNVYRREKRKTTGTKKGNRIQAPNKNGGGLKEGR